MVLGRVVLGRHVHPAQVDRDEAVLLSGGVLWVAARQRFVLVAVMRQRRAGDDAVGIAVVGDRSRIALGRVGDLARS